MQKILFLFLSLSVALAGTLSISTDANAAAPQELVSQLSIASIYSDPKGAVLVIFGSNQALARNFVFLGDSQSGGHELTQLEFEGGMGQSGQGSDYTRTFKSADQRTGTLYFANEGVYVLSGGRTNFFAATDKSKYLEMLKSNQIKIHLLPTIREGAYVFKSKEEDFYITLDNSDRGGSALDEFEVFAGKSGTLSFVGSGKSKPAGCVFRTIPPSQFGVNPSTCSGPMTPTQFGAWRPPLLLKV